MQYPNHPKTYLALSGAVVFWGLSFVATKIALETVPLFTLIFLRFGVASCLLAIWMFRRGQPGFTRKEHLKMLMLALFDPGLYFIFETLGLKFTAAPKAALIIASVPLVVMIFSAVFLEERANLRSIVGIFLSLLGIGVLIAGDPEFSLKPGGRLVGDLLILGAVITAALYNIAARDLGRNHSVLKITGLQFIYGSLFYLPVFLWECPKLQWSTISIHAWGALAYLTVFATVGAFFCYNYALSKLPAVRAAVFINGIPVVTALGAWLILGEKLTLLQVGGGALVLISVALANFPSGLRLPPHFKQTLLGSKAQ